MRFPVSNVTRCLCSGYLLAFAGTLLAEQTQSPQTEPAESQQVEHATVANSESPPPRFHEGFSGYSRKVTTQSANHFYIHAIEASPWPERGTQAAERLQDLVPGSGHLVHMPSHIFIRTGRYADAARANERAIAADEAYFAVAPPPNFYSLYFLHNVHFLAYAIDDGGEV